MIQASTLSTGYLQRNALSNYQSAEDMKMKSSKPDGPPAIYMKYLVFMFDLQRILANKESKGKLLKTSKGLGLGVGLSLNCTQIVS